MRVAQQIEDLQRSRAGIVSIRAQEIAGLISRASEP